MRSRAQIRAAKRKERMAWEAEQARKRRERLEIEPSIYALSSYCYHPEYGECYSDSETGYYWKRADGKRSTALPDQGQKIEWIKLGAAPAPVFE